MRIIHICQRDDPATGGALRVAEALAKEQTSAGNEVWILFLYGGPASISAQFTENQVICLRLSSSKEALRGIPALRRAVRHINPEIIHSHDSIVWPRLALYRIGIPVFMHAHLPAWNPHTPGQRIGWALINKTTDFLIGISHHTIESWLAAGFPSSKIRFIPNGVDFRRFHIAGAEEKKRLRKSLGLPESKKILLWVGQMHRSMKGTDRMEHVAARLPEDTIMLAVGNGPEFCGIQQRCKPLLESGRLVMTGTVPEPAPYYMASDAFLFTSYHEPFGLVILEAVACGLPVLAFPLTQGGGAAALFEEFRAVPLNDAASKQEVEAVLRELEVRKKDAARLRSAAAAGYDWRRISAEVVAAYHSVLNRGPLRIIVCQHGARHRYAIPRILASEGVLTAFYTDSSGASLLGKCAKFLGSFGFERLQRIRWDVHALPQDKVFSSDWYYFHELLQALMLSSKNGIRLYQQRHRHLSAKMMKWGLQGANVVYSMYHENLDFIRWAKQQGARSVIDVFVSPLTDDIVEQESRSFADWTGIIEEETASRLEKKLWEEAAEIADILICPSEWVAEGVRSLNPAAGEKIRIVPYGCSLDYGNEINVPEVGRILFAGREALRKGLHYLARAATQLKADIPQLDVRVAGSMPSEVVNHPICKDLNFIGQLDREQMKQEFLHADAFVLPALSEGFASVVAESLGAGCPVIVTKETGSPIVHEREGLLIPSRDAEALADAIKRMVLDREFRNRCAENCLAQKSFYSEDQWKSRLLKVLDEVADV